MKKLDRVLLFVDDKPDHQIIAGAIEEVALRGAELTLAAVVERSLSRTDLRRLGIDGDELERDLVQERQRELEEAVQQVNRPDVDTETVVLVGRAVESIVAYASEQRFDLLIKAPSPTGGLRRDRLGGTDQRLLRTAPCTVAIGRPQETRGPQRAVVAVDVDYGDEENATLNRGLLDSVLVAQGGEPTEVYVVHAWDLYGYTILASGGGRIPPDRFRSALDAEQAARQRWLDSLIRSHRQALSAEQAAKFDPKTLLVRGDAIEVIPEKVRELEASVLGLGTVSRSGVSGFLIGNTAEEILHRVDCTVVVHRPS